MNYRMTQIKEAAGKFNIPVKDAVRMRAVFLRDVIKKLHDKMAQATDDDCIIEIAGEMLKLKKELRALYLPVNNNEVTQEMIENARNHPVELLIEFTKGKALAFCHDDRTPSLSLDSKRNRAHCFVCNKGFDSIEIMRQKYGMTFHEAVKSLVV